ncbi:hypothetical protein EVG20_g6581 [Dentipellis fragilis]|uniref:Uncharacterized protein n=1 Tax=Dentipellis fragilis TaxID=205917 RepID=A0A4Y9YK63_9AGAM|nr:hypothetical protein EVG20_g6581 [Dentipellis fragilis]
MIASTPLILAATVFFSLAAPSLSAPIASQHGASLSARAPISVEQLKEIEEQFGPLKLAPGTSLPVRAPADREAPEGLIQELKDLAAQFGEQKRAPGSAGSIEAREGVFEKIKELLQNIEKPTQKRALGSSGSIEARSALSDKIKEILTKLENIEKQKRALGSSIEARSALSDKIKEILTKLENIEKQKRAPEPLSAGELQQALKDALKNLPGPGNSRAIIDELD